MFWLLNPQGFENPVGGGQRTNKTHHITMIKLLPVAICAFAMILFPIHCWSQNTTSKADTESQIIEVNRITTDIRLEKLLKLYKLLNECENDFSHY